MLLTVSIGGAGFHPAAWRFSPAASTAAALGIGRFRGMTQLADRLGCAAAFFGAPSFGPAVRDTGRIAAIHPDPMPLISALIDDTGDIGLGGAFRLDLSEPYNVARSLATIDRLSLGRSAWIVDLRKERLASRGQQDGQAPSYARDAEFIEVVCKLWDSWEAGAFVVDKPSGRIADPDRIHRIDHQDAFFSVRGPLNLPRPVQGHPVLVFVDPLDQDGRKLAAETADVVLVNAPDADEARRVYAEFRALRAATARRSEPLLILQNVCPVIASSESEAKESAKRLADAVDENLALSLLQDFIGRPDALNAGATSLRAADLGADETIMLASLGLDPNMSTIDAGRKIAAVGIGLCLVGAPAQIFEKLEERYALGACDGFNLAPSLLPNDLELLAAGSAELTAHEGKRAVGATLRERLGLPTPISRYAKNHVAG